MKLPGRLLLRLIAVLGAACLSSSVREPIAVAGIEDTSLHKDFSCAGCHNLFRRE